MGANFSLLGGHESGGAVEESDGNTEQKRQESSNRRTRRRGGASSARTGVRRKRKSESRSSNNSGEALDNNEDSDNGSTTTPNGRNKRQRRSLDTAEYIYKRLFLDGESSDVTIDALGRSWNLHKVYLKQSSYFESMFSGSWKESDQNNVQISVDDSNITAESLNHVIASLYRGCIKVSDEDILAISATASLLQLDNVLVTCSDFLAENLNCSNVLSYLEIASCYGLFSAVEASEKFLEQNLFRCADNVRFLKEMKPKTFEALMSSTDLLVRDGEHDLYSLLKRWLYLQLHPGHTGVLTVEGVDKYFKENNCDLVPYLELFKRLRLENILITKKTTERIYSDGIIPSNVLRATEQALWRMVLQNEETSADLDVSDDDFSQYAFRCGRVLDTASKCWRWSGFNFGTDILLTVRQGVVTIKRNCTRTGVPVQRQDEEGQNRLL